MPLLRNVGKMQPRTRFLKMYHKLPDKAKENTIYLWPEHPITARVAELEIFCRTRMGDKVLESLGYKE